MGKLFNTIVVGAASGAAAAYFLGTKKGKAFVEKVKAGVEAYQAEPDTYHQAAREKVTEYKNLAVETFSDYKNKWETGELSADSVTQVVKQTVDQVKGKVSSIVEDVKPVEPVVVSDEDIVIDFMEEQTTADESESAEDLSEEV